MLCSSPDLLVSGDADLRVLLDTVRVVSVADLWGMRESEG
jgi:hypothetical protein